MKLHGNAALSLNQRRRLAERVVKEGWSLTSAARKWARRYRLGRSSRAQPHPRGACRRDLRLAATGMTAADIAEALGMAETTVSGILLRVGLGRLGRIGLEPARRYERSRPGELIHIDIKKLGRIDQVGHRALGRGRGRHKGKGKHGWEFVHVCVDDATRLAYVEVLGVLGDEKASTPIGFLRRSIAFLERHGVEVERVLTDNGSAYRSAAHALACRALGVKHIRTRPYRPQTNGKAERFIRTMLGGWAYGAIYRSSPERTAALEGWLWRYNFRRPQLNNPLGPYT